MLISDCPNGQFKYFGMSWTISNLKFCKIRSIHSHPFCLELIIIKGVGFNNVLEVSRRDILFGIVLLIPLVFDIIPSVFCLAF